MPINVHFERASSAVHISGSRVLAYVSGVHAELNRCAHVIGA